MNVLYFSEPNMAQGGGVNNVAYYLTKALREKVSLTYFPSLKSNRESVGIYYNVLRQFLRKQLDIIHFNIPPTWVNGSSLLLRSANLRETRTVLTIHDIPYLERIAEKTPPSFSFQTWLNILSYCRSADRVVVNSKFMGDNAVSWYRINPNKITVIPNGIDLKRFALTSDRIVLEGNPSVLCLGHMSKRKGVDVLIRAMSKLKTELPNIKLHLVGGGYYKPFEVMAKEEGVEKQVIFHGWAQSSLLPSYYKSADICVFPSRHEGFGIVILEAMASGIPVIASNIPSFREIISDGVDGRLFESEDANALSKEVIALYQDPGLRKDLVHNALEKARKYSWENIADEYISLYKSLCE